MTRLKASYDALSAIMWSAFTLAAIALIVLGLITE